ncbi:MAG: type IV pilus assembly protein PilM [Candidatus Omnitrophota bacterium]
MRSSKKKGIIVGLDIGSRSIKAAEVSLDGRKRKLTKFQISEIDLPQTPEKIDLALKSLLGKLKTSAKIVNVSLSAPSAIVRFINMPIMKEDELKNSLSYEAEKYIPFNISEVIVDACILADTVPGRKQEMRVLLAAAKKDAVNSRIDMLKKHGFSIAIIDIDSFACFNAYCDCADKLDDSKSIAILNIGYTQTNIVIANGSSPYFTRDIQIGGRDIARALSDEMKIDENGSDRLLCEPKDRESQVFETAKSVLSSLIDELRLSFGYYENQYGKGINEIYISGGIAKLPGIAKYCEEHFGARTVPWDPFSKFEIGEAIDAKSLEHARSQLAVCAGLAIRG